jgi:hypothetical protein
MHSKLLHEALQKEETRAIVIEVEEGPEEPREDEEFYAANFELLGQEDEDEEEGMESYDEVPPLVDSDEEPDKEPPPFTEDRPAGCEGPQTGDQRLSRRGTRHGQRVLLAFAGRGWQYPGDPCAWSG